jgi:cytochrome c oxidase subunit 1
MPKWALVMGQVVSYASGVPVLLVTAYGALRLVQRSGLRWDAASRLLLLGVFGWSAGMIPAVIDGTIAVNRVMHNTQWVPGHFHFYLLLGLVPMILGFMAFTSAGGRHADSGVGRGAFWGFVAGGLGVILSFLAAGARGVPRRFAAHLESWQLFDSVGAVAGALVVACVGVLVAGFLASLRAADGDA